MLFKFGQLSFGQYFFVSEKSVVLENRLVSEFFKYVIKIIPCFGGNSCKLLSNLCFFGPNCAYPKSMHSVHTQKMVEHFFYVYAHQPVEILLV